MLKKKVGGKVLRAWSRLRNKAVAFGLIRRRSGGNRISPSVVKEVRNHLSYLCENIPSFQDQLARDRSAIEGWPCLPRSCYEGKDVLDLGCDRGSGGAVFLERGARFVWGIDPLLTPEVMRHLSVLPQARFSAAEFTPKLFGKKRFDLVYAQFVTEHIGNLVEVIDGVFSVLKPGGRFVGLHDNYYGPMGGHDHAFMGPTADQPNRIHFKGVRCWDLPEKCEASAQFRREFAWRFSRIEMFKDHKMDPTDCSQCAYHHRSHLWSHLIFQDSYPLDFAGDFFKAGRSGGLNKVTPFQLKQFLIEAGFANISWQPQLFDNEPAPELASRFSSHDLRTATILFAADKPRAERVRLPLAEAA